MKLHVDIMKQRIFEEKFNCHFFQLFGNNNKNYIDKNGSYPAAPIQQTQYADGAGRSRL